MRHYAIFSNNALQAAEETKKKMPGQAAETITLLHYNDVYNVESREVEPVGGAASKRS